MTKEEFFFLTDEEAVQYIIDHYCMDDINDACEDFVIEEVCEEDEDEYECLMEESQPFEVLVDQMDTADLKEYLWDEIVERCEEIDQDAPDFDTDCVE